MQPRTSPGSPDTGCEARPLSPPDVRARSPSAQPFQGGSASGVQPWVTPGGGCANSGAPPPASSRPAPAGDAAQLPVAPVGAFYPPAAAPPVRPADAGVPLWPPPEAWKAAVTEPPRPAPRSRSRAAECLPDHLQPPPPCAPHRPRLTAQPVAKRQTADQLDLPEYQEVPERWAPFYCQPAWAAWLSAEPKEVRAAAPPPLPVFASAPGAPPQPTLVVVGFDHTGCAGNGGQSPRRGTRTRRSPSSSPRSTPSRYASRSI
eukprot:TRINITY_DN67605_c0_g1_i1.p1 TRINITY_DN67605_c0_g1~~TRINITY_DN67605_c0_g1_i1.p1  ORF type:complete len:285 (+),score=32.86 TRINITY_DN67605_c0_g1_i1:76-855(+)